MSLSKLAILTAALTGLLAATAPPSSAPSDAPGRGLFRVDENLLALSPTAQVIAIVGGTLISEDLTCIAVGMLIHHGKLSPALGGFSCFLGIYIGDLLFFLIGRLAGKRVLRLKFFSRSVGEDRLRAFGDWFDRRPWAAIAACRILPGLRVPLYVTVGALTRRTAAFFWWTCFFAFVWTPALIYLVVVMGDAFTKPFEWITGTREGWASILLGIATIYLIVRTIILLCSGEGRAVLYRRVTFPARLLRGPGRGDALETTKSDQPG